MSENSKKKPLILSTLILFMAVVVVTAYCLVPSNEIKELEKYNIKFDSDGGNSIAAIEIEEGSSLNELPEDPTREGYIFVGWMLGDELYDFSQGISGDLTLKAGWKKIEADKVYYTVSFDTNGGTTYANQVVEEGELATRPATYPVKDGYTFIGWQLDGTDYDFNAPVIKDITITANWEENKTEDPNQPDTPTDPNQTFNVRFDANGGVLGNGCGVQTVKTGTKATNSCQVTRNGYTFTGWSPNITRNITADTTFRAQWKQNPVVPEKQYLTVKFDANGGNISCPLGFRVESGTSVSNALNIGKCGSPNRQYYNLTGWSTNINGGGNVTTLTGTNTTVLYAQWVKKSYKVSCATSGGIADQTCTLAISGLNASEIKKLTINYKGRDVPAQKVGNGFVFNVNVWNEGGAMNIEINGQDGIFNGTK